MIRRFRELGYTGPHTGVGKHPEYMTKNGNVVKIPNAHQGDIGEALLKRVLSNGGISYDEWIG